MCLTPGCENRNEWSTQYCGSCNRAKRKAEANALKTKVPYQIPKVSEKQKKKNALYTKQRKEHLAKHPHCQLKLIGCERIAIEIHHSEGRGENTNKIESFLSACGPCHKKLHDKLSAKEARELGLKK